ncbi:hypothetical protein GCM10009638_17620 [Luteococcus sanguinis]
MGILSSGCPTCYPHSPERRSPARTNRTGNLNGIANHERANGSPSFRTGNPFACQLHPLVEPQPSQT